MSRERSCPRCSSKLEACGHWDNFMPHEVAGAALLEGGSLLCCIKCSYGKEAGKYVKDIDYDAEHYIEMEKKKEE